MHGATMWIRLGTNLQEVGRASGVVLGARGKYRPTGIRTPGPSGPVASRHPSLAKIMTNGNDVNYVHFCTGTDHTRLRLYAAL